MEPINPDEEISSLGSTQAVAEYAEDTANKNSEAASNEAVFVEGTTPIIANLDSVEERITPNEPAANGELASSGKAVAESHPLEEPVSSSELVTENSGDGENSVERCVPDTGVPDTGVPDTGVTDTGVTDTGVTDTGVTDAGVTGKLVKKKKKGDRAAAAIADNEGASDTPPPPQRGRRLRRVFDDDDDDDNEVGVNKGDRHTGASLFGEDEDDDNDLGHEGGDEGMKEEEDEFGVQSRPQKSIFGDDDDDVSMAGGGDDTDTDGDAERYDPHTTRFSMTNHTGGEEEEEEGAEFVTLATVPPPPEPEYSDDLWVIGLPLSVQILPEPFDPQAAAAKELSTENAKRKALAQSLAPGKIRLMQKPDGQITSNARLVEFTDGSCALFIGTTVYEADARTEGQTVLIESSQAPLYRVHGAVSHKRIFKPPNVSAMDGRNIRIQPEKDRRTRLTTVQKGAESELRLKRHLEEMEMRQAEQAERKSKRKRVPVRRIIYVCMLSHP
eukprot:Protomagalhaensia_sp_Gyna_25__5645@NODE_794_length_2604_cov_32_259649_g625_i0_p1_GENE_NODE_794_length_2604_cov_32_259649_g625_i0NODE_794_length_2604_cov_32_259649_g625_i0_p1_ORF_typecomplete_len500_score107_29Leo1/PF04004_13/3_4e13_NODE_794_length_2604_cov_32_259649_g625_i010932592